MEKKMAVLFDLDGTLLNTLEDLGDSVNATMRQYNWPEHSYEEVRHFVGNGVPKLIERAIPDGLDNPLYEEALSFFKGYYEQHMQDKTKPYQGVMDLLKMLKEEGYPMAVVSNKFDEAVKVLCKQYFGDYIQVAIGESAEVKKKPAPDTAIAAMKELSVKKEHAIYVGDSEVDIKTAHNAGLRCISVTWGFREKEFLLMHSADICVDKPEELLYIVR